jgi:hypothetical protein
MEGGDSEGISSRWTGQWERRLCSF